jgi:hypothetical protein
MEQEMAMISKNDLLKKYGISYGTLYRWKRMRLIPEEWFVKKATSTGQETFFPDGLISKRVEKILERQKTQTLEQIAQSLSQKEQSQNIMLIKTPFGKHALRIQDVLKVEMSRGDEREDITRQFKDLFEGEET